MNPCFAGQVPHCWHVELTAASWWIGLSLLGRTMHPGKVAQMTCHCFQWNYIETQCSAEHMSVMHIQQSYMTRSPLLQLYRSNLTVCIWKWKQGIVHDYRNWLGSLKQWHSSILFALYLAVDSLKVKSGLQCYANLQPDKSYPDNVVLCKPASDILWMFYSVLRPSPFETEEAIPPSWTRAMPREGVQFETASSVKSPLKEEKDARRIAKVSSCCMENTREGQCLIMHCK